MTILNFGSINADIVFAVDHMVAPGETTPASAMAINPGGKGANQSVALAKAGARVLHAGMVGQDTRWMIERMNRHGVDTRHVMVSDSVPGGQAIIQVDRNGQNAIVIYGGANQRIPEELMDQALADTAPGDWLVLQNEINLTAQLIRRGHDAGLKICLNPSPMTPDILTFPLELVNLFMLNEIEGATLAQLPLETSPEDILKTLQATYPQAHICLTLGHRGAVYACPGQTPVTQTAFPAEAVDTTAAGDTFTGFLLAALAEGQTVRQAMALAARAAAITVARKGAMDSIPTRDEL